MQRFSLLALALAVLCLFFTSAVSANGTPPSKGALLGAARTRFDAKVTSTRSSIDGAVAGKRSRVDGVLSDLEAKHTGPAP